MKNGAPVVVHSEPWSQSQLDMRVARGCHSSANEFKEFLMEEFLDFGRKGFWILLPYEVVRRERTSPFSNWLRPTRQQKTSDDC